MNATNDIDTAIRPSVCLSVTLRTVSKRLNVGLYRDGRNYFTAGQPHSFRTTRPNCYYEIRKCGKCTRSPVNRVLLSTRCRLPTFTQRELVDVTSTVSDISSSGLHWWRLTELVASVQPILPWCVRISKMVFWLRYSRRRTSAYNTVDKPWLDYQTISLQWSCVTSKSHLS